MERSHDFNIFDNSNHLKDLVIRVLWTLVMSFFDTQMMILTLTVILTFAKLSAGSVRIFLQGYLYAVTQHLLTRRNFIFLNSLKGFWRSLGEIS